jgi:cyclopropane fatty-acyl-phospholipid synthase-like methyltransferase
MRHVREVFASTERTGLWVDDCEVWRLHYHATVRNWRQRFADKRAAYAVSVLRDHMMMMSARRGRTDIDG